MRVGLVVYGGLEHTSGGYLYDRLLVEHLRERGDDVEVVSLPWRTYGRHLADNLSPAVHRRLRGEYDVLLQDELCHPSLVLPNRRLGGGVPVVALVHSLKTEETRGSASSPLFRAVERAYLRTVDGVVCTSAATRAAVDGLVSVPGTVARPGRGHRSPDVTREAVAARAGDDPLRVLFVGNVVPRKGVLALLDGLARLPIGSWRLTVVGSLSADRRSAAAVRRRVARHGLGDAVTLTGRVSDAALADHLRRHHVLAVPSTYEAFGIAYLEGMGYGLPALATTAGGADEVVTDGEDGFLVAPGDPAAVAEALGPLVDDRDRLRELALAALETYAGHHDWDATGRRVRTFLRQVADGAARPARTGDRNPRT